MARSKIGGGDLLLEKEGRLITLRLADVALSPGCLYLRDVRPNACCFLTLAHIPNQDDNAERGTCCNAPVHKLCQGLPHRAYLRSQFLFLLATRNDAI
jgi:hypothetical protein